MGDRAQVFRGQVPRLPPSAEEVVPVSDPPKVIFEITDRSSQAPPSGKMDGQTHLQGSPHTTRILLHWDDRVRTLTRGQSTRARLIKIVLQDPPPSYSTPPHSTETLRSPYSHKKSKIPK